MTKQETIAAAEVMKAWADGKVIEYKHRDIPGDTWQVSGPNWNWLAFDYRVKPEPREFYLTTNSAGVPFFDGGVYPIRPALGLPVIKVREVID